MKIDVLLGLQWGDEGKGKIVDFLTPQYDVIARFQGGPNAGHSLEFENQKYVLHSIPSGIFRTNKINIVGNGVVIDPVIFEEEIIELRSGGCDISDNLLISKKAHLILPTHRLLDAASENEKGRSKIGSTLKGIGPTYMDKTGRNGLRVGDLLEPDFERKYKALKNKHLELLSHFSYGYEKTLDEYEKKWLNSLLMIRQFQLIDSEYAVNKYLEDGKKMLAEGAQGTLLDVDFGSYPFVTSSNTVCAAACTGLGVAPGRIGEVIGIFKAYVTRVGSGPFPTELSDETGTALRDKGHEYGATTGRPRRCGWLDLVALKYSIMINWVTQLIMTKADVLSGFEKLKVCTGYKQAGADPGKIPFKIKNTLEPQFTVLPGWLQDISQITDYNDLPQSFMDYKDFIQDEVQVPIKMISVGPERNKTIFPD